MVAAWSQITRRGWGAARVGLLDWGCLYWHDSERRFATVFLGSGLLFAAMIFAAAAVAGGVIAEVSSSRPGAGTLTPGRLVSIDILAGLRRSAA